MIGAVTDGTTGLSWRLHNSVSNRVCGSLGWELLELLLFLLFVLIDVRCGC